MKTKQLPYIGEVHVERVLKMIWDSNKTKISLSDGKECLPIVYCALQSTKGAALDEMLKLMSSCYSEHHWEHHVERKEIQFPLG